MKREADMDDAPNRLPTASNTQRSKSRKLARGKIKREVKEERLEAQPCKIKPDPDATAVYGPVPIHIKKEEKVDVKQESRGRVERLHCSSPDQSVAGGGQSPSEECDSEGEKSSSAESSSAESSSEESDSESEQSSSDEESESEDVAADAAPASQEDEAMSEGCEGDVKESSAEESDNGGGQSSSGEDSDSECEQSSSDEDSEIEDAAAAAAPASQEDEAMSEDDVKAPPEEESETGDSQSSSGDDSDSDEEQSSSDEDSDREGQVAAAAQPDVDNRSSSGGGASSEDTSSEETSSSEEDSDSEAAQSTAEEACATAPHPAPSKKDPAAASSLNPEQLTAFRAILDDVLQRPRSRHRVCTCVGGASGTGKSHLLQCLLAAAAAEGATCLATAFSAKAAQPLGGQTVHSLFGLREWGGVTSAAFPPRDNLLRIRSAGVIAVDDALMLHAAQVDAVVDILDRARFDGVLLFSINPGAVLPVHVGGTLSDRIDRSIHSAKSWPCFKSRHKHVLTKRMRIHDAALADFVHGLSVGAATAVSEFSSREGCEQQVMLPRSVFTPVFDALSAQQWVLQGSQLQRGGGGGCHGMVICTTNAQVDEHNNAILQRYQGQLKQYPSHRRPHTPDCHDSGSCDAVRVFTPESSITRQPKNANMEDYLCLKVGVPVRVTCKVCPEVGLYTDARAAVVALERDVVAVRLVNEEKGQLRGGVLKLGRADFEGVHQFPLKLAWAVTAHRAAAFTPERVVADLRRPCWAHGQLAVMLNRVRQSSKLRVLANSWEGQLDGVATRNVVIKEVVAGCLQ